MKRGVVANSTPVNSEPGGFSIGGNGLSADDIRFYTMYWDRVLIPSNSMIHVQVPDEDILISSGVIERPEAPMPHRVGAGDMASIMLKAQVDFAAHLIKTDRMTDWVIHQMSDELVLPESAGEIRRTLRLDLTNTLPVPSRDVPIEDVLDFKLRRGDELRRLHNALDEIYLDVLRSPDQELSSRKAVADLAKAIGDISTVSLERWSKTSKFDYSVNFNLDRSSLPLAIAAGSAGAAFDFFSSAFSVPIGAVIGSLSQLLSLKAGYSNSISSVKEVDKLSYLACAHKENILS